MNQVALKGLTGAGSLIGLGTAGSIAWNAFNGKSFGNPLDLVWGAAELGQDKFDKASGKRGTVASSLGNLAGGALTTAGIAKIAHSIKTGAFGGKGKLAMVGLLTWQGYQLLGEFTTPDNTGGMKDTFDIAGNVVSISALVAAIGTKNFTKAFQVFAQRGALVTKVGHITKGLDEGKYVGEKLVKAKRKLTNAQDGLKEVDNYLTKNFREFFQPIVNVTKPATQGIRQAWTAGAA